MKVLAVGEILWDVFLDRELLGGAALNFCANVRRLGNSALLLSGVGKDSRGAMACEAMTQLDLDSTFVQVIEGSPTGTAEVRINSDLEPDFTIDRPAAFDCITIPPSLVETLSAFEIDWLYFGTLMQTESAIELATQEVARTLPGVRCFYDMNLREGHWNLNLVMRLCRLASILKLSESEAQTIAEMSGTSPGQFSLDTFCPAWAKQFDIDVICVTLGSRGCYIHEGDSIQRVPGYPVTVCDTIGSGDAFAAAFLHGYHDGWPSLQAGRLANALGAVVASRAGATPYWRLDECETLQAPQLPESEEMGSWRSCRPNPGRATT